MKKLCIYFFLVLFSLHTPSWADDIRDFQIEGISIGDSALDFFSEDEIENKKKKGFVYPNKEFYSATFRYKPQFKLYDGVQFHLKAKDKRYIIYSIGGKIYYPNNINKCPTKLAIHCTFIGKLAIHCTFIDTLPIRFTFIGDVVIRFI